MKTNLIIIWILLFFVKTNNSYSQVSREWVSTYHSSSEDAKVIVSDNNGNVYVTGSSGSDYATIKYNSSGIQQWAARYNGTGNSGDGATAIAVDASGNVYVTGSSTGIGSSSDFLTIKYNSSGTLLWSARFDGPVHNLDNAYSIAVDSSGNVFVTGNSYGGLSDYNYLTIKYNSSGVIQWFKNYNGTGNNTDNAFRLVLDGQGNVYVTGWSRGSGTSDDDFATIKYNSAGDEVWVRIYQGPGDGFDQAMSIAADRTGNIYVTGRSLGISTQYDYATIKYNSSGDSLWVNRYNGVENSADNSTAIAVDTSGNVYVFGQSYSSVTNYDFATVKYNSAGVYQWDRIYNGPGNSVENGTAIALDKSGNVYVTGASAFSGQNYNYATVKYSSAGVLQWSDTYNGTASGSDESFAIAADSTGNIYVTGGSAGLGQFRDYVTIKYSQKPYAIVKGFIEGFYNSITDKTVTDTVKIYLRSITFPYSILDSSRTKIDSAGTGKYYFANVTNGTNYYLQMKHRNSIETWSFGGQSFNLFSMTYDFSTAVSLSFGNNSKQIDSSPIRFGFYSGDVDQDGTVDAGDLSQAENDAANSLSGYVQTDVTGDDFVDAGDVSIIENNAAAGISAITP